MTQMGLEYMKHKETARHNVSDEGIRGKQVDVSEREADTKAYVASFKPQEVEISERQADASLIKARASASQADTAKGKLSLDTQYRERETVAKEGITAAQMSQAETALKNHLMNSSVKERETLAKELEAQAAKDQSLNAAERNRIQTLSDAMRNLDPGIAAAIAASMLGWDGGAQIASGVSAQLSRLIPNLSLRLN